VPLLPAPWLWAAGLIGVVALACLLDAALAGAVGDLRLARDGATQVTLDDTAEVALTVTNTGGRVVPAGVRDARVPSAGASPYRHRIDVDPDQSVRLVATLRPTRRGDRHAVRVTIRSCGPLGLAYRQPTGKRADAMTPAWRLRVLPRFTSRRFLPEKLTRLRIIDGMIVTRGRG